MATEKNKWKYYFITEKGKEADLKSEAFFLEEKEVLQLLEKKGIPCSIFKIKELLEEKKVVKSWEFIKKTLEKLEGRKLVAWREQ